MVMQRWQPFRELERMQEAINRLWGDGGAMQSSQLEGWAMPLDVIANENSVEIRASLPDVDPDQVDISVEDDVLTIKGQTSSEREDQKEGQYLLRERRFGSFYRAVRLPDVVDTEKAESSYENGVLTITFPKSERAKAKKIQIKGRGNGGSKTIEGSTSQSGQSQQ